MLIARKPKSAHWYLPDGTPFHEVPNASKPGEMRPATIRDAIKAGAFRSVTNVLDMVAKPGLVNWQVEQAMLSALTLPRLPNENDHDFAERAIIDADAQAEEARRMGTMLHDACAQFVKDGSLPMEVNVTRLFMPFVFWMRDNVETVLASEVVIVDPANHYAGRMDLRCKLLDGRTATIDMKGQDVPLNPAGIPKPTFYAEWPLQLAAYAPRNADGNISDVLISLVMDRNRPGIYPKEWAPAEGKTLAQTYLEPFLHLCAFWSYVKGSTPGKAA